MAKKTTKKPPRRLSKAGTPKPKPGDKVIVLPGSKDVDAKAISEANAAVGEVVTDREIVPFPTLIDLKKKVSEGLIASNYNVFNWAQTQFVGMVNLAQVMEIIEKISFTEVEIRLLTPLQRMKLWKIFDQAMTTRIELMQVINAKANEFHLAERFLQGAAQETDLQTGIPKELPYSPEFRAKVRAEYTRRVLERTGG